MEGLVLHRLLLEGKKLFFNDNPTLPTITL